MLTTSQALARTLWIGGPAAAGKTTVSRLLARRHGLRWYSTDARMHAYKEQALREGLIEPEEGPGDFDRKPMIYQDLRTFPEHPMIIAEGAHLTPDIAVPSSQALWLMPSEAEQHIRLVRRHPEGVHDGYYYGRRLIEQMVTEHESLPVLRVDGQTVMQTLEAVESHFASALERGLTATTLADRRKSARAENELISAQATRADNPSASEKTYEFACECGSKNCSAFVDMTVADAKPLLVKPVPAILAPGH